MLNIPKGLLFILSMRFLNRIVMRTYKIIILQQDVKNNCGKPGSLKHNSRFLVIRIKKIVLGIMIRYHRNDLYNATVSEAPFQPE